VPAPHLFDPCATRNREEDSVLFPLTEELLSVQEQEMLAEDFGRLADAEGAAEDGERGRAGLSGTLRPSRSILGDTSWMNS
jgi:hypothetical protein